MQEKITKNVSWIGIRDWELRNFHSYEYSTKHGSTYNSYLVTDKKTALIDTVWKPFAEKFVKDLSTVIDLHKIDYVIANHGEIRAANDTINIKMFNSSINDKTEIITEIFRSKAVLIGSPTINKGVLSTTAAILEFIRGLELKNKKAAAFGTYGWSGEGVKIIEKLLKDAGLQMMMLLKNAYHLVKRLLCP